MDLGWLIYGAVALLILTVGSWIGARKGYRDRAATLVLERGSVAEDTDISMYVAPAVVISVFWPLVVVAMPILGVAHLIARSARRSGEKSFRRHQSLQEREAKVARLEKELGIS